MPVQKKSGNLLNASHMCVCVSKDLNKKLCFYFYSLKILFLCLSPVFLLQWKSKFVDKFQYQKLNRKEKAEVTKIIGTCLYLFAHVKIYRKIRYDFINSIKHQGIR